MSWNQGTPRNPWGNWPSTHPAFRKKLKVKKSYKISYISGELRLFKNLECRVFKTGSVKKSSSGQALSTKDSTDWEFAWKLHMKTLSLLGLGNYRN